MLVPMLKLPPRSKDGSEDGSKGGPPNRANWLVFVLAVVALAVGFLAMLSSAYPQSLRDQPKGVASAKEPERTTRRTLLRFLTTADFPPFNYLDEDGVLTGFHVDLARAICLELTTQCDVTARPWEDLLPAVTRHQADAVIAGHMVSARAMTNVDFTDRYFFTPGRFVGRRGNTELEITPGGLASTRIGVTKGTTHEAYLQAFFPDSAIVASETQELTRDALLGSKVDLVFGDGIGLVLWINGESSKGCCELKGGPYLEPKYFGDGIAIAIPKNDAQLKSDINAALRKLRASGRFEELVLRYFPYRVF
jgi:polar amino acid transport system substrate-binding protein